MSPSSTLRELLLLLLSVDPELLLFDALLLNAKRELQSGRETSGIAVVQPIRHNEIWLSLGIPV